MNNDRCHHTYIPFANIYGDLRKEFHGSRTVLICSKCGQKKYTKKYILSPYNYNIFLLQMYHKTLNNEA